MRLNKTQMNWRNLDKKLWKGIALSKREETAADIYKFGTPIEKLVYTGARATHQLEGFGNAGIVGQLQSGEMIPDQLFGWSTKTVLAALLALTVLKLKKSQA